MNGCLGDEIHDIKWFWVDLSLVIVTHKSWSWSWLTYQDQEPVCFSLHSWVVSNIDKNILTFIFKAESPEICSSFFFIFISQQELNKILKDKQK